MIPDRATVRALLKAMGTRARKSLGQNFLVDAAALRAIADAAALSPADTVVEVGPGLGFLTQELLSRAGSVIAVEVDPFLVAHLTTAFRGVDHLRIAHEDIRSFTPPDAPYVIVANLPYYLSSFFLRRFVGGSVRRPTRLLVLLQREVADKLTGEESNILGLSVAAYGIARNVLALPPDAFEPPPSVHSTLVAIDIADRPRITTPDRAFFSVVKMAFHASRKKLSTSLRGQGLSPEDLASAFREAGVDPNARPSTLSLEAFDALAGAISRKRA